MIEILFACHMGTVKKEIKLEKHDDKKCEVYIDNLSVGRAKHNPDFCPKFAEKLRIDMQKKGYTCEEVKPEKQTETEKVLQNDIKKIPN